MKQILLVLTIGVFAACGSSDNTTNYSDSSTAAPLDTSNSVNPPLPDTAKLMKDTSHVQGDTMSMQRDTPMSR